MADEATPVEAEPVDEQPVDPKPVDPPVEEPPIEEPPVEEPPVEEPPPEPKRKIQVQLKGGIGPMVEIEEDATTVELPVSAFEVVVPPVPEVWDNVTTDRISIVNEGRALAWNLASNKPFAFLLEPEKWVWVDEGLQVQKRQQP